MRKGERFKFQLAIVNRLNAAKGYSVRYVIIVSEFALHFFAEISNENKFFTRDLVFEALIRILNGGVSVPKPGEANLANLPGFRPDHSDDEAKMDVELMLM